METIKTAVVVVLLLAVLYGVWVVLNRPDLGSTEPVWDPPPIEEPPAVEEGTPVEDDAALLAAQQGFTDPDLAEPVPASFVQGSEVRPRETVTDELVPTPADPPPTTYGAEITEEGLTSVQEPTFVPEGVGTESPSESVYDVATVNDSPAKGAPPLTSVEREADQGQPFRVGDEAAKENVGSQPNRVFQDAWNAAIGQLEKSQWKEALHTLSSLYNNTNVTGESRSRLMDLLDPLAGRVVYSNEHTFEPAYEVRPGETLQDIADRYQVPMALLQNINGIRDPSLVQPGTQLKVLRGPFRAEIDQKQQEMALFLDDHYAGRFAISIGNDPKPNPAEYRVEAKQPGREYYAPDQSTVPAGAPDNPYGNWWIGLGGDVCVHGSPDVTPAHGGFGCVSLSSADAADIYQILTVGSKVLIR